jgi:hypothetical protein
MTANEMLGRVTSCLNVLVQTSAPLGTLLGGALVERTGSVALLYGTSGSLVVLTALVFAFTALARAEQYLPAEKED